MKEKLPMVVIFGRTNVGKSTLFNCLSGKRQAIVSGIAGTTRDSNTAEAEWRGSGFFLVDTGGILEPEKALFSKKALPESKTVDDINYKVQKQAVAYLKEADLILFVVDNKTGLLPADRAMVNILKQKLGNDIEKKIILVANKADSGTQAFDAAEFNKLSLGEPMAVSATTGAGTGDLLDEVIKFLKKNKKGKVLEEKNENIIRACILGKPNVGKSSLLNALLGYERAIVSPVPHTTREPQNIEIEYEGQTIALIDTAGISRHGDKQGSLIKYGIEKTMSTMARAEIVLLVLDVNEGLTHQDVSLAQEAVENGKGLIIIANKWDLVKEKKTADYARAIWESIPFAQWAPIQFVSAKTTLKVKKIFDLILEINKSRQIKITDRELGRFLSRLVKIHRPAKGRGVKHPRIYEFKQVSVDPQVFMVRIGVDTDLHFSYLRFLKNRLREKYKITGTPIEINVTKNRKVHGTRGD